MSESGDYTSTNWVSSHDFTNARSAYKATVVDRGYSKAASVDAKSLVKTGIKLDVPTLIVVVDVTGSMGEWPATMFSKLPYLMHELRQYMGDNAQLMLMAVGDAKCDNCPLQVQEPSKDFDAAKASLEKLAIEGGGGGQTHESYELGAGYLFHAVELARNIRPVVVFIGDEHPYDRLTATELSAYGITASENLPTDALFKSLGADYDIYLVHKPYGGDDGITSSVRSHWQRFLPAEHVVPLADPARVVDVIFGILAGATGKVDYFTREITERQTKDQVKTVLTSLAGLHKAAPKAIGTGKSTYHGLPSGKATKPLL